MDQAFHLINTGILIPTGSLSLSHSLLFSFRAFNFNLIVHSVGGILPTGQLSNVPWRRTGVKYTNNEAYFDVIEEIDAIIDKAGSTVIAEVQGYV